MYLSVVFLYFGIILMSVHCVPSKKPRELIHIIPPQTPPDPHPPPPPPPPPLQPPQFPPPPYEDNSINRNNYHFNYVVDDDYTGNYQTREETKDGHRVTGSYSVLEPTGAVRTVKYVADKFGFRAIVRKMWPNRIRTGFDA